MDHFSFRMPGTAPPMGGQHPPPQYFGGYGSEPIQHLPPDIASQMFDSHMYFDDPQDPKRRRIARACDMCRKKKIKCDGKMPSCTQCLNYKTECVFTPAEKKRQPPKGAKYIEGLENRLYRMEQVLRLSGLLDDDGETDLGALEKRLAEKNAQLRQDSSSVASAPASPSQGTSAKGSSNATPYSVTDSPDLSKDREHTKEKDDTRRLSAVSVEEEEEGVEEQLESLSEMMCSLVTNQSGETRYIGSSSGFSIFSPKGIQWVNSKTGDNSFQHMISEVSVDDHKWTNWKPEVFQDVFRRPVFRPLPPKDVALSLLKDYFENFNCMCPLFHQPTFMHLVERQYSDDPYEGSGWWASLNCALAISHRLRVMSNLVPHDEDDKAWGHIKNAMGVFAELTLRNTDLLSVQALIGIALFMQGTPNPQPSFVLVAAAIRLSHNIGLHKRVTGFNLNPIEVEQRKRVFWIAYMLDKDLCLRSGRPPAQDDDDMTVELPDADPADNIGNIPLADGKSKMNLFRTMCEFAVIESKVYNRLYSTKASKQSDGELLNAIGELDQELEEWKDSIPVEFRPEHEIKASHTPLILHVVMLHFAYYNCLTTIHRMSVNHGFWSSRLFNYAVQGLNSKALNPRVYSSSALCTASARASIALLKYIPQGDNNCVWMILYFPVSALMTLFANIINNPMDVKAKSDARLMGMVVQFLSMLGQEAETGGVNRMLGVCAEFERIAGIVIEKAEKEPRRKRKNPDAPGKAASMANLHPGAAASVAAAPQSSPLSSNQTPRPSTAASNSTTPASVNRSSYQNYNGNSYSPHRRPEQPSSYSPLNGSMQGTSPSTGWQTDYSMPQNGEFDSFVGMNGFAPQESPPVGMGIPFQQPLLPQDLFSLPMNLDWNWAELCGGAYPTVENGRFGDDGQMHHHRQ